MGSQKNKGEINHGKESNKEDADQRSDNNKKDNGEETSDFKEVWRKKDRNGKDEDIASYWTRSPRKESGNKASNREIPDRHSRQLRQTLHPPPAQQPPTPPRHHRANAGNTHRHQGRNGKLFRPPAQKAFGFLG
jgi:hypothetical protein